MNVRIRLIPTDRTDVICVACFQFIADHVIVRTDGTETDSGIHARCVGDVQLRLTRKRQSQTNVEVDPFT